MNRFYHLARYNLGLSPLINGTGFMVKFDIIKPTGWDTNTLTEDIEFSLKTIISGKNLGGLRMQLYMMNNQLGLNNHGHKDQGGQLDIYNV